MKKEVLYHHHHTLKKIRTERKHSEIIHAILAHLYGQHVP